MPNPSSQSEHVSEVDTALLDAELFIKYQAPERAIKRLLAALEAQSALDSVARTHCAKSVSRRSKPTKRRDSVWRWPRLYIERDEFDDAYDRLLEAKQLDARINIAGGLEAIRRARRPDLRPEAAPAQATERVHSSPWPAT